MQVSTSGRHSYPQLRQLHSNQIDDWGPDLRAAFKAMCPLTLPVLSSARLVPDWIAIAPVLEPASFERRQISISDIQQELRVMNYFAPGGCLTRATRANCKRENSRGPNKGTSTL